MNTLIIYIDLEFLITILLVEKTVPEMLQDLGKNGIIYGIPLIVIGGLTMITLGFILEQFYGPSEEEQRRRAAQAAKDHQDRIDQLREEQRLDRIRSGERLGDQSDRDLEKL